MALLSSRAPIEGEGARWHSERGMDVEHEDDAEDPSESLDPHSRRFAILESRDRSLVDVAHAGQVALRETSSLARVPNRVAEPDQRLCRPVIAGLGRVRHVMHLITRHLLATLPARSDEARAIADRECVRQRRVGGRQTLAMRAGPSRTGSAFARGVSSLETVRLEELAVPEDARGRSVGDEKAIVDHDGPVEDVCGELHVVGRDDEGLRERP